MYIVETTLALLQHSHVANKYWKYAFDTTAYIINRLPPSNLKYDYPFSKLFHQSLSPIKQLF